METNETTGTSFEANLKNLEELIEKLESGSVPLEDMMKMYEEGMRLYDACDTVLKKYEDRFRPEEA